jgi:hypothetical protein
MLHSSFLRSFLLTLLVLCGGLLLVEGCESSNDDLTDEPIVEERDPRFAQCYYEEDLAKNTCDSVLMSFFGVQAATNLNLNNDLSFIGCDENDDMEMLSFGDEHCCLPRTYDLVYDMIYKGDTVCQVPMVAGSEMGFEFISEEEKTKLLPYKALLQGDIEFDYADLISEMKRRNMDPEQYEIELIDDLGKSLENSIFWELSFINEDDVLIAVRVGARDGVFVPTREIFKL